MNDEPKRRGRPPRVLQELSDTPLEDNVPSDEAVVENPIAPIVEQENATFTEQLADTASIDADGVEARGLILKESPIEEKIHQLVDDASMTIVPGWENNMRIAPTDGRRIMVSETAIGQGSLVYWRISKVVDKKNLRYIPKGRWTDFLTKKDIEFIPVYWKAYNPEEYWPLTV